MDPSDRRVAANRGTSVVMAKVYAPSSSTAASADRRHRLYTM
jgi:hypothetical protein